MNGNGGKLNKMLEACLNWIKTYWQEIVGVGLLGGGVILILLSRSIILDMLLLAGGGALIYLGLRMLRFNAITKFIDQNIISKLMKRRPPPQ